MQLVGGIRVFARTRDERAPSDPRLSVTERYASRDAYLAQVARDANGLVRERLLLAEDIPQLNTDAGALWNYVMQGTGAARP